MCVGRCTKPSGLTSVGGGGLYLEGRFTGNGGFFVLTTALGGLYLEGLIFGIKWYII